MKTITIVVPSMILALLSTGCASNKVAQQRGWIGGEFLVAKRASWSISGEDAPIVPAFPKQLEGKQKAGVFVSEVYSNTPLALAAVRAGDLILAVNNQPIETMAAFRKIIDGSKPGSTLALTVFRDGQAGDSAVMVGRETFKNWHVFSMGIGISGILVLDLIPNPNFSLIALGYSRSRGRVELNSPRNVYVRRINAEDRKESTNETGASSPEGWRVWLAIFSLGSHKSILSQEMPDSNQTALAAR